MTTDDPSQLIFVIDDDEAVRDSMGMLLDSADLPHRCFASADEFLAHHDASQRGCLVLDIRMPGTTGLELQQRLAETGSCLPIIFMTGHGDVPMAVEAMRRGAFDFLRKPVNETDFLERVRDALDRESGSWHQRLDRERVRQRIATLTEREHEVFQLVAEGIANKAIASELGISERTVEVHRAQVMKKLGAKTLAQLVRIHLRSE
ncbi:MAG: response regulator [Gammaproteobacteria bacterium]|nr:response regulator [Gammaproteobacteria bacterium]MDH3448908.1 response regulator [Gammaproteobacteria bacterium]